MTTVPDPNLEVRVLDSGEVSRLLREGAVVLDVRPPDAYGGAHIAGAINVNVAASGFGERARMIIPIGTTLVLVGGDVDQVRSAAAALADEYPIGGALAAEPDRWCRAGLAVRETPQLEPATLAARMAGGDALQVLDVRERREWDQGHLANARFIPFYDLLTRTDELDPQRPVAVYCATGQRSSIAASILERAGFRDVANVAGGITAWTKAGLPTEPSS